MFVFLFYFFSIGEGDKMRKLWSHKILGIEPWDGVEVARARHKTLSAELRAASFDPIRQKRLDEALAWLEQHCFDAGAVPAVVRVPSRLPAAVPTASSAVSMPRSQPPREARVFAPEERQKEVLPVIEGEARYVADAASLALLAKARAQARAVEEYRATQTLVQSSVRSEKAGQVF